MSSGNICKNNPDTILRMIKILSIIDPKRKFILKWQLFKKAGDNIPLLPSVFSYAYNIAMDYGFKTTASVFDIESLNFLLQFDIPFVKLANRPDLYWLIGEVPRKIPVIISRRNDKDYMIYIKNKKDSLYVDEVMCCISEYPAKIVNYEKGFAEDFLRNGISDHTVDFSMYLKYRPQIYECHFKLPDSTGLDAGEFARTPEQISEIYEEL